jgi:hypothetical protein
LLHGQGEDDRGAGDKRVPRIVATLGVATPWVGAARQVERQLWWETLVRKGRCEMGLAPLKKGS